MSTTVRDFAAEVKIPVDMLLAQLKQAGVSVDDESSKVTEADKRALLVHLAEKRPAAGSAGSEPRRITLKRKETTELRLGGGRGAPAKMVSIEVRKRRTYVKRGVEGEESAADAAAAAKEQAEHEAAARAAAEAEARRQQEEAGRKLREEEEARRRAEEELRKATADIARAGVDVHARTEGEAARKRAEENLRRASEVKRTEPTVIRRNEREGIQRATPHIAPGKSLRRAERRGPRKGAPIQVETQHAFQQPTAPVVREVEVPEFITVGELANRMAVKATEVIKVLMGMGVMVTINQSIDQDTATLAVQEMGHIVKTTKATDVEDNLLLAAAGEQVEAEAQPRAPIVTVMGHVDHGKTSLLDAIRATEVASGERGGITQHIGASEVVKGGQRVVFLDTPGHEAFTAMRARGAKVTDIAVLVVAADDGVMPQTLEAIDHARAAKVPIVVALNKIDKADANPERVKTELSEHGVVIEEYGGDVPLVPVSAKTGTGIEDLIDTILVVSDVQELKANPKRAAIGTVVEAELDKGRGPVATVLVQTGTLNVGDVVVVGETYGRIRALENSRGERVKKAGPSSAVVVLGLAQVPAAGDILRAVGDEKTARSMVEANQAGATRQDTGGRATLEDLYRQIQAGQTKELRIILKADVQGSLGAIGHALEQIQDEEVRINVIHQGAGDISDNDILLASASDAIVVGFNTKLDPQAKRTAEAEGVDVRLYDIIYRLTEEMDAALKGLLEPEEVELVEGRAEVRQIFRAGRNVIAGSYVTDGRIVRGGARVYRGGKLLATDRIESLRRFRDDVREVASGFECGIGLAGFNELEEGDIIECFSTQMVSRIASA